MFGIIGAMDVEIEEVRSMLENPENTVLSGILYTYGTIGGVECVVAKCGVGKVFAAMCTQTMILNWDVDAVINVGIGGTLTKELSVGDIAVASSVCQHDMDTSAVGDPVGMVSGVNMIYFETDTELSAKLEAAAAEAGYKTGRGIIASGDQFVADNDRKNEIASYFGAIACDMEIAAIGQVAYVNGVPFAAIRSISDSADGSSSVDYFTFKISAAKATSKVLSNFFGVN